MKVVYQSLQIFQIVVTNPLKQPISGGTGRGVALFETGAPGFCQRDAREALVMRHGLFLDKPSCGHFVDKAAGDCSVDHSQLCQFRDSQRMASLTQALQCAPLDKLQSMCAQSRIHHVTNAAVELGE